MHAIERFSLERHVGPYESWPRRTPVFDRGAPTQLAIRAYAAPAPVRGAWRIPARLDDDCPTRRFTTFCLPERRSCALLSRALARPALRFFLRAIEWIDERALSWRTSATSPHPRQPRAARGPTAMVGPRRFVLARARMPYLWPRLALRRPGALAAGRARFETKSHLTASCAQRWRMGSKPFGQPRNKQFMACRVARAVGLLVVGAEPRAVVLLRRQHARELFWNQRSNSRWSGCCQSAWAR
jgi:hypothetical protein